MADITKLKTLLDLYGVGVRAGAITPQRKDEEYFRDLMEIPKMSRENLKYWEAVGGLKHPITLRGGLEDAVNDANPDEEGQDAD